MFPLINKDSSANNIRNSHARDPHPIALFCGCLPGHRKHALIHATVPDGARPRNSWHRACPPGQQTIAVMTRIRRPRPASWANPGRRAACPPSARCCRSMHRSKSLPGHALYRRLSKSCRPSILLRLGGLLPLADSISPGIVSACAVRRRALKVASCTPRCGCGPQATLLSISHFRSGDRCGMAV